MKNNLSEWLHTFAHPEHLMQNYEFVNDWAQIENLPRAEKALFDIALLLSQGAVEEARKTLQNLGNQQFEREKIVLLDAFKLLCLFEKYDRWANDFNSHSADLVMLKKRETPYPNRFPNPPEGDTPFHQFLKTRYRKLNLRTLRGLLQGQRFMADTTNLNILVQDALAEHRALWENGDLLAGLDLADLCRRIGDWKTRGEVLQTIIKQAETTQDDHLMGLCWMQMLDAQIAPLSGPHFFDFLMESSTSQGASLPFTREQVEFHPPKQDVLEQAKQGYQTAIGHFQKAESLAGSGMVYLRFSYTSLLENRFEQGLIVAGMAADFFEGIGDQLNQSLAEAHQVCFHILQHQSSAAYDLAEKIGETGAELGANAWFLSLGLFLGRFARHLSLRMGQHELALVAHRAAQIVQQKMGHDFHAAQHFTDMGDLYKTMGLVESSIAHYEQAADAFEELIEKKWHGIDDPTGTAVQTQLGVAMLLSDNFLIGQKQRNGDLMQRSVERMGKAVQSAFSNATAEQKASMPQLVQIQNLQENQAEVAAVLAPLYVARTKREQGDDAAFEALWEQAKNAAEAMPSEQSYHSKMAVYATKNDWQSAKNALEQYLNNGASNQGFLQSLLQGMQAFGAQGQQEIGLQSFRDLALAHASYVRIRQYEDAKRYFEKLNAHYGERWFSKDSAAYFPISEIGEMYEGLGDFVEAEKWYDESLKQVEEMRSNLSRDQMRVAFAGYENVHYLYSYAARNALRAGKAEKAFSIVESGKARALLDLMQENVSTGKNNEQIAPLLRQQRALDARLSLLTQELLQAQQQGQDEAMAAYEILQETEQQRMEIEVKIKKLAPDFLEKTARSALPSFAEICKQIPGGSLLVQMHLLGDTLLLFAVDKAGIVQSHFEKIDSWRISAEVHRLLRAIESKGEWKPHAAFLSEHLVAPISSTILQYDNLIFVPHGILHRVPFQTLYIDNQYLGFEKTISFLPSASVLCFGKNDFDGKVQQAVIVGNPNGDLPASAEEAQFVHQLLSGKSQLFVGEKATETAIRRAIPTADLLHFATHGNLSANAPLHSSITLAKDEKLSLAELMSLQLNARLVVLSACDTGKGDQTGGDEVLGLTRGLLAAGAQSALVSLWPVDDASTALLMKEFYTHYLDKKPAASALRSAQMSLAKSQSSEVEKAIETNRSAFDAATRAGFSKKTPRPKEGYAHPYYWAAFVLVG